MPQRRTNPLLCFARPAAPASRPLPAPSARPGSVSWRNTATVMLSFQTEFPVSTAATSEDFLQRLTAWMSHAGHTAFRPNELAALLSTPRGTLRTPDRTAERPQPPGASTDERLEWLSFQAEGTRSAGIHQTRHTEAPRHAGSTNGATHSNTLIFSASTEQAWVSIRVETHDDAAPSTAAAGNIAGHPFPPRDTEHLPVTALIHTLLESLGGGSDGLLRVTRHPRALAESEVELAAKLIRGEHTGHLPIVYASLPFAGTPLADLDELADRLAGLAHVVVEPSRQFSTRLKLAVQGRNVYGGTLGIYWPDERPHEAFYLGPRFPRTADLIHAVIRRVRQFWLSRKPMARSTWAGLQEAGSFEAIRRLKASGSLDLGEYIEKFDQEILAKDQKIRELDAQNQQLRAELSRLEAIQQAMKGSVLEAGEERDLFPNESLGIILDALADALSRATVDSRRQHVLRALLQANPLPEDHASQNREQLKHLLRGMRGMTPKIRRGLEDMGFSIDDSARHIKLVFCDDDRYTYTLPKSGSDARGGLNAANDIGRLMF